MAVSDPKLPRAKLRSPFVAERIVLRYRSDQTEGLVMPWTKGRGVLGRLNPLLGEWVTAHSEGDTAAVAMRCRRSFLPLGKGWVELDARWETGPGKEYRERAFFGAGEDGSLTSYSFTSDGKRS